MSITDTEKLKIALERPFHPSQIHWRVGATNQKKVRQQTGNNNAFPTKGIALAYINARDVMKRLDQAVGFGQWQNRYTLADGGILVCEIGLRIDGEWLWRSNGAGETQIDAEKGKASDSFKRAAVMWGIGRYLYSLDNIWVDIDYGKIKTPPALPDWATPAGYDSLIQQREEKKAAA